MTFASSLGRLRFSSTEARSLLTEARRDASYTETKFDRLANSGKLESPPRIDPPSNLKGKIAMKNIFVGNISFGTTEHEIRSLFEAHGTVERVNMVTDRDTGQSRGFCFVEMTNDAEAQRAIAAINGKDLGGRALNVNEARPKADRASGGGRPGGGRRVPRW